MENETRGPYGIITDTIIDAHRGDGRLIGLSSDLAGKIVSALKDEGWIVVKANRVGGLVEVADAR